ncbi:copper amine oxidase N-terminal domain-containing protein [Paenibacillus sp. FA6]|uniref:copper amine oxidase N-terminal domain-containing protein n=1 Tax=Paenibacillus sp. FA6 TaxID=3413029 RepID=UPI003F657306
MNKSVKIRKLFQSKLLLLLCIFFVSQQGIVYADSPITSTAIYQAYLDVKMVTESKNNGLSEKVADFLSAKDSPLDERAAVINALYSDQIWNERNFTDEYAIQVYGMTFDSLDIGALRADEVFVLGYMRVLDHYMDPDVNWLSQARKDIPDSMTVALVYTIALSQQDMMCSWNYIEQILTDQNLHMDIRQDALDIIVRYMELYKGSPCQNKVQQPIVTDSMVNDVIRNAVVLSVGHATVLVKGTKTTIDYADTNITPYVRDGKTMVPLRFISSAFGAQVNYDQKKYEVTIQYRNQKIVFNENKSNISINGFKDVMNTTIEKKNDRIFVPLRVIMEVFDKNVYYDQGLIIIADKIVLDPRNKQDEQVTDKIKLELLSISNDTNQ